MANGLYAIHAATQKAKGVQTRRMATATNSPLYATPSRKIMRSSFADPTQDNLSGILDTLKAVAAPYMSKLTGKASAAFQSQIQGAQTSLENKLGQFLQTGQTLNDIKGRAQAQQNSSKPEVSQRAQAISNQASALISQYNAIKDGSLATVQTLVNLKNQLTTDPIFSFADPMSMGSRVVELYNKYKDSAAKAVSDSVQMAARIDAHTKQVKQLSDDVSSLESYAQGKGWSATLSSIGSSYMDLSSSLAKIALVGVGIYFLAPSFMKRIVR